MSKTFDFAVNYTLENEGGFTIDSGGPTNFGITIPDYATFYGKNQDEVTSKDIQNLPISAAELIYYKLYWMPIWCDRMTSKSIVTSIFDVGVNLGLLKTIQFAQITCANEGYKIKVDKQMGPYTLEALNTIEEKSFVPYFSSLVSNYYERIIEFNPEKYSLYKEGWLNRAKRLLTLLEISN